MAEQLWDKLKDAPSFWNAWTEYNKEMAESLQLLNESPYPILGRDSEIQQIYDILERPRTPVALLLGQAGVGKSAAVEEFARQLNNRINPNLKVKYLLVSLQIGKLKSLGTSNLQAALSSMLSKLKEMEQLAQLTLGDKSIRIVLFIDEVHMIVTIFGPGTKIGGDLLKAELARTPIRVIAATTRREYDSTIAVDRPLAERFKNVEMNELPKEVVLQICKAWWSKIAPMYTLPSDSVLNRTLDANAMYRAEEAEPRKSLDLLEDFVSYCKRTGKTITDQVVDGIFERRFSISLTLQIEPASIYQEIASRVKGQPYALETLKKLTQSLVFRLDPTSDKPLATALFTGSTGTGKTETAKAIAHAMYPGKKMLVIMNMPDFKTPEHDVLFRRNLGEIVRHQPSSVIVFDELEKAHNQVLDSLLAILDEGIVNFTSKNREGQDEVNRVSLRNTVIIATTNAGQDVFKNDAKYSSRGTMVVSGDERSNELLRKAETERLLVAIKEELTSGVFKPELVARFNRIVPYRALDEETFIRIAESQLYQLAGKFKTMRGINITYNKPVDWDRDNDHRYPYTTFDVALYIAFVRAKSDDSSQGARKIKNEVDSVVYDAIVDCIIENPYKKNFKVEISKDSDIYVNGVGKEVGGVIVHAY